MVVGLLEGDGVRAEDIVGVGVSTGVDGAQGEESVGEVALLGLGAGETDSLCVC